jgi:hypothetical protein
VLKGEEAPDPQFVLLLGCVALGEVPQNSRRAAESIIPPDGRSLGNGSPTAAGPLIQAERVPDAENEIRCTVIEPQSNVEIDLLRGRKAIRAAGIDKLSRAGIVRLVADVLRKKTCLLAHLLLDNEGGLSDELAYRIGGPEELHYHSSEVPTIA